MGHHGHRGRQERGELEIVEGHHGRGPGQAGHGPQHSGGDPVVAGENGGRWHGEREQANDGRLGTFAVMAAEPNEPLVERQTGSNQGLPVATQAFRRRKDPLQVT